MASTAPTGADTPGTTRPGYSRATSTSRPSSTHRSTKKKKRTEFLLPSGRRVIVALPSDIDRLRRRYLAQDPEVVNPVEVVVHGSPEHLKFLGESKEHHEARHEALT